MKNIEPDTAQGAVSDGNRPSMTSVPSAGNGRSAPEAQDTGGLDSLVGMVSEAEAAHVRAGETLALVGRKPPTPPTARGFLGERVLELIQPLFAWYTHGLRQYFDGLEDRGSLFVRALQAVASEFRTVATRSSESDSILQNQRDDIAKLAGAISDLTAILQRFESRLDSAIRQNSLDSRIREDLNAAVIGVTSKVRALEERAAQEAGEAGSWQQRWARLEADLGAVVQAQQPQSTAVERRQQETDAIIAGINGPLLSPGDSLDVRIKPQEQLQTEWAYPAANRVKNLSAEISRMEARFDGLSAKLLPLNVSARELSVAQEALSGRLSMFLDSAPGEVVARVEATILPVIEQTRIQVDTLAERVAHLSAAKAAGFSALYKKFEDVFRGTREDVKSRQRVYLPELHAAGVGTDEMPIVDLGCGRGEWLELLYENGLRARGVDANSEMLQAGQALGLAATQADALSFLKSLPDDSVGAVTAFHLAEHLPFDDLLALISEAYRVMRKDGVFLLETPNPNNIFVGARNFYIDPTHRHPLPVDLMRFVVEAQGFSDVVVHELNALSASSHLPDADDPSARFINQNFFGPQDYGVLARKREPSLSLATSELRS